MVASDDFRNFTVASKVKENDIITSFYLAPVDGKPLPTFHPGQFLTFRQKIAGVDEKVTRTYSVSSAASESNHYRISVKREPAPVDQPELPAGLFSNYLHDQLNEGDEILARGPSGHFYLNEETARPVVLLSGGIGLTPLVSMAHALVAQAKRKVWFIHACENGAVHAFADEIKALAEQSTDFKHHFCYRKPVAGDVQGKAYDSEGFVSSATLQSLLPIGDYEFYLCGPPAFMAAEFENLIALGVREDRISYEFFGPATVLRRTDNESHESSQTVQPIAEVTAVSGDSPLVTFKASNISAQWDPKFDSLLDFAESLGLSPDFSCRAGICNTCSCKMESGDVNYSEEPLDEPESGSALICCSAPVSDLVLDL